MAEKALAGSAGLETRIAARLEGAASRTTPAEWLLLHSGITIGGGANVILLDEPTAGMSKSETGRFIGLIRDVTEGKTLLTVEHDMGVVFGLADRIAVVVYGEVLAFDTPDAVRANVEWKGIYWEPFIFVGAIFFLICFGMSRYSMYLERRLQRDHR